MFITCTCYLRYGKLRIAQKRVLFDTRILAFSPKEITVHSGIVWRDTIYGDRRQTCERVQVSTIKYQLFRRPKMKYLLFTFARLDPALWEMANCLTPCKQLIAIFSSVNMYL
jgi:hypothetical protein